MKQESMCMCKCMRMCMSTPQPPGWTGIVDLKSCCSVCFDLQSTRPFPFLPDYLKMSISTGWQFVNNNKKL